MNEIPDHLLPNETALEFLTKTKTVPIKSFGDFYIFNKEIPSGIKGGDIIEIYSSDTNVKTYLLVKLLTQFVLPYYIINKDEKTQKISPIISFKKGELFSETGASESDDIKILYLDNCRSFRYKIFIEFLEKIIYVIVCRQVSKQLPEEQFYNVFGGEEEYRSFVFKLIEKVHLKQPIDVKDFWYSIEYYNLINHNYRLIFIDSFNSFYHQYDKKMWENSYKSLQRLINKKNCSLIFTRIPVWRKKVTIKNYQNNPSQLLYLLDKSIQLYEEEWKNKVNYQMIVNYDEKGDYFYSIVYKSNEINKFHLYKFKYDFSSTAILFDVSKETTKF